MTGSEIFTPPPITGYRDLNRAEVNAVNLVKAAERDLAKIWGKIEREAAADPRWTAIARQHFEQGFMALNRAIMKPANPFAEEFATIQQDEAEQIIPRRTR